MPKRKKSPPRKGTKSKKRTPSVKNIDPEMDVLEERFSESPVDFNSLLDLVK